MTVYIPIVPIFMVLTVHFLIGYLLMIPLAAWQDRFISSNSNWRTDTRWLRAVVISPIFWPYILFYNIKTEIEYRKKGYL